MSADGRTVRGLGHIVSGAENVCEHGDHPAPDGQRFCSPECQACEHDIDGGTDDGECSGICLSRQESGNNGAIGGLIGPAAVDDELISSLVAWLRWHAPSKAERAAAPESCRLLLDNMSRASGVQRVARLADLIASIGSRRCRSSSG